MKLWVILLFCCVLCFANAQTPTEVEMLNPESINCVSVMDPLICTVTPELQVFVNQCVDAKGKLLSNPTQWEDSKLKVAQIREQMDLVTQALAGPTKQAVVATERLAPARTNVGLAKASLQTCLDESVQGKSLFEGLDPTLNSTTLLMQPVTCEPELSTLKTKGVELAENHRFICSTDFNFISSSLEFTIQTAHETTQKMMSTELAIPPRMQPVNFAPPLYPELFFPSSTIAPSFAPQVIQTQ